MTLIALMPPLDYLPDGNQNFVFGRVTVPPGYTREATLEFAELMENVARPLWESDTPANGPPLSIAFSLLPLTVGHLLAPPPVIPIASVN